MVARVRQRYNRAMSRSTIIMTAALVLWACGDEPEPSASVIGGSGSGVGGGGSNCEATTGTLSGTAIIPGEAIGSGPDLPADNATIVLTPMDGVPIQAMADADGHFEVVLEGGMWTVAGEHPDQCFTPSAASVVILPCATTQIDLELSDCFG